MVRDYGIQSVGESARGKPEYRIADLEAAYQQYLQKDEEEEEDSLTAQYNKAKVEHKIEQTKNLRLVNAQLERNAISVQEVVDFWSQRKAIELAILRKILMIDMPMQVPGLSHADARTKGERYYNKILNAYEESNKLWTDEYDVNTDEEIIKKLNHLIFSTEQAHVTGSCGSGSFNAQENSGSANT